jgi:FkbM family methyltransferase
VRVGVVTEADIAGWLGTARGWAAEVGASDGVRESPTYHLEQQGWTVLCVEPIPEFAARARRTRKIVVEDAASDYFGHHVPYTICNREDGWHMQAGSGLKVFHDKLREIQWEPKSEDQIEVFVRPLNWMLEVKQFPRLDFLSVDTEGTEDAVLRGANLARWMPRLIAVENWPNDNKTDAILLPLGYKHVARDDRYTDWYVL